MNIISLLDCSKTVVFCELLSIKQLWGHCAFENSPQTFVHFHWVGGQCVNHGISLSLLSDCQRTFKAHFLQRTTLPLTALNAFSPILSPHSNVHRLRSQETRIRVKDHWQYGKGGPLVPRTVYGLWGRYFHSSAALFPFFLVVQLFEGKLKCPESWPLNKFNSCHIFSHTLYVTTEIKNKIRAAVVSGGWRTEAGLARIVYSPHCFCFFTLLQTWKLSAAQLLFTVIVSVITCRMRGLLH